MIVNVTLPSDNTSADVADYNDPITRIVAAINGQLDDDNILSLSGTKIAAGTLPQSAFNASLNLGWIVGVLTAPTSITNNGNGSYDLVFSTSQAALLANGMRLRATRSSAAPTYMSSTLNGTNQYFTKTTPSGTLGTVTNNFTIMGYIKPGSYAALDGGLCGRGDAALNNGLFVQYRATTGILQIGITNGGVANIRTINTYVSVPITRKTHFAVTWSSGTVTAYINGISVPVGAATTGGTAPTVAGTGGDWSIGRIGAFGNYFNGNISGVGVFNAVLSAATIRQYATQALVGNEANCIGAWSLNNTPNDQNAAANNLTPQGSASYTSGLSPYSTDTNESSAGLIDYALVMKVNGTTVTVQVPEGCTLPASGISSLDYATGGVPFGWIIDKNRWKVLAVHKLQSSQLATSSVVYNIAGVQIMVPIGLWTLGYDFMIQSNASAGVAAIIVAQLSPSSSVMSEDRLTTKSETSVTTGTPSSSGCNGRSEMDVNLAAATPYYMLATCPGTSNNTLYFRGDQKVNLIYAIPAGI